MRVGTCEGLEAFLIHVVAHSDVDASKQFAIWRGMIEHMIFVQKLYGHVSLQKWLLAERKIDDARLDKLNGLGQKIMADHSDARRTPGIGQRLRGCLLTASGDIDSNKSVVFKNCPADDLISGGFLFVRILRADVQ